MCVLRATTMVCLKGSFARRNGNVPCKKQISTPSLRPTNTVLSPSPIPTYHYDGLLIERHHEKSGTFVCSAGSASTSVFSRVIACRTLEPSGYTAVPSRKWACRFISLVFPRACDTAGRCVGGLSYGFKCMHPERWRQRDCEWKWNDARCPHCTGSLVKFGVCTPADTHFRTCIFRRPRRTQCKYPEIPLGFIWNVKK